MFCSRVQRSTSSEELWSARVLKEEATDTATTLVTGLLIWICMQTGQLVGPISGFLKIKKKRPF